MENKVCFSCGASGEERILLVCEVQGEEKRVCPKCLPRIIHG